MSYIYGIVIPYPSQPSHTVPNPRSVRRRPQQRASALLCPIFLRVGRPRWWTKRLAPGFLFPRLHVSVSSLLLVRKCWKMRFYGDVTEVVSKWGTQYQFYIIFLNEKANGVGRFLTRVPINMLVLLHVIFHNLPDYG